MGLFFTSLTSSSLRFSLRAVVFPPEETCELFHFFNYLFKIFPHFTKPFMLHSSIFDDLHLLNDTLIYSVFKILSDTFLENDLMTFFSSTLIIAERLYKFLEVHYTPVSLYSCFVTSSTLGTRTISRVRSLHEDFIFNS